MTGPKVKDSRVQKSQARSLYERMRATPTEEGERFVVQPYGKAFVVLDRASGAIKGTFRTEAAAKRRQRGLILRGGAD